MKKSKLTKALLVTLCAVLLVAGSVLGTLAYLTARTEVVENTFTVGDVQISLDEVVVNPDGTPVDGNGDGSYDREEKGNEYHLVPGKTYPKDPTVTVKGKSEPSYVRMMVTINCISELKAIFGKDFLPQNYVAGWYPEKWECVSTVENDDNTVTYEFRYHSVVDASGSDADITLEPLFTHFTIPGEVDNAQLKTIDALEIAVEGHAIQAATFVDDEVTGTSAEDAAWAAFDKQVNP